MFKRGKSRDSRRARPGFRQVSDKLARRQNASVVDNVEWNRERWGQVDGWLEHDAFGYNWGSSTAVHTGASIAKFVDLYLRPFLDSRYDLDILEISPGAGRFTVELVRYAKTLTLVDLNAVPIDICRERLKYYPIDVKYVVNDGTSLEDADGEYDLVASFDSLVHVHPDVVRGYLEQGRDRLRGGGLIWVDHSGRGVRSKGRRSAVTADMVAGWSHDLGLELLEQKFRNGWDCISVMRRRTT